jgi:phage shock protein PspC (stress-responsive transcriptional regulator)
MKKTININLGGQAFIIDEQAYELLHRYFEALRQKFTNESEQKEILSDIEARVAEVFAQRLGKTRAVVNEEDVLYIMSLMGKPEDIAGETESTPTGQPSPGGPAFSTSYTGPVEKKFFRDPDNKKVGGVISGICYYFGWRDPSWVRVSVVVAIVLSMFAHLVLGFPLVVIYLILLIVVPQATTSAEKLQMRGQPVTIQNIEKEVRDAMTTAGSSIHSFVKDKNNRSTFASAVMAVLTGLTKIFLVFVIMICVLLMLVLAGFFFGFSILSSASLSDLTHMVVSGRHIIMFFNVGAVLTFGIPLIAIMYLSIKFLTGSTARNPVLRNTLIVGWFVGFILLSISTWDVFKSFAATDTVTQKVQLLSPRGGTLMVQLADTMGNTIVIKNQDENNFSFINMPGMATTGYGVAFSDIKVEIAVSPDSNFYVEKVAFSRGASTADAARNIQMMRYKFSQTDTTLNLDDKFELPKNGQWRAQKIKIRIYVPEGKNITFADNMDQIEASVKGNDYFDDGLLSGKLLHVENGKIKCPDCKAEVITDEDSDTPDDTDTIKHKEHVNIQISNGGKKEDLKNVSVNINQNGLSLTGKNDKDEKVKVKINNQGIKVITVDTNGNTSVTKK